MLDLINHSVNFFLHLFQFGARKLQLSTRPQTHILDLTETGLILRLYLIDLLLCIVVNLLHCLLVISLKCNDLILELLNLVLLDLDIVLVCTLFPLHFSSMHFEHVCLGDPELCGFLLGLVLELLIASCIFEHFLGIVVSLGFQLIMVLLSKSFDLFVKIIIDFLLRCLQLLDFVSCLELIAIQLFLKLLYFLLVLISSYFFVDSRMLGISCAHQFIVKLFLSGDVIFHFDLFSQYFL